YRSDLMPSEDSEFLFRLLKAGARGVHVPDAIVIYRMHQENQISGSALNQVRRARDWIHCTELVASQLDQQGELVRRMDALRWRAIVWAAHRHATKMNGGAAPVDCIDFQFGPGEAGLFWLMAQAKRLCAGLRARVIGSAFPRYYQLGPLSPA